MTIPRNVLLWVLYDFANSFTQIVFIVYFTQWIVVDQGLPDLHLNLVFPLAALLLLATVPVAGYLLDTRLRRITGLRLSTTCMLSLYAGTAVAATNGLSYVSLGLFLGGFYMFLLTFTFYTVLLKDIAAPGARGRVSGYGVAANYAGQIMGLALALPFATGALSLLDGQSRAETLLPSVIACALFALPMLLWFSEPRRQGSGAGVVSEARALAIATRALFHTPGIMLFLLAYFLFNDAILTASANFSIFLERVWGLPDTVKTMILLGVFVTSAIGGVVSGALADRFGHKRAFVAVMAGWVVVLPALALIQDFRTFVCVSILMGFLLGGGGAVARSCMAFLAPEGKHNLAFGYFGLIERASSLVGPLAWGLIVSGAVSTDSGPYRIALLAMTAFIGLSIIVLLYVKGDSRERSATP